MKRVILSATSGRVTWSSLLDTNKYNMDAMRKNNVTIGTFKCWLDAFEELVKRTSYATVSKWLA